MENTNNTAITEEDKEVFYRELDFLEGRLREVAEENFDKRSSITEKGGRPFKYTPKELAEKGIEYFEKNIEKERPLTISGLALTLDTSRRQLINWQGRRPDNNGKHNKSFDDVVSILKNFVGYYYEIMGERAINPCFYIFVLKKLWGINSRKMRR